MCAAAAALMVYKPRANDTRPVRDGDGVFPLFPIFLESAVALVYILRKS